MCQQRLGEIERQAHELADHLSQSVIATRRGQGEVAQVVVDLEVEVVFPVWRAPARAGSDDALVEAAEWFEAAFEDQAESFEVHSAVEGHDAGDHHEVGWVFHPQPGRIDACHRDPLGHSSRDHRSGRGPNAVMRIDGDFGRLHDHPDLGSGSEPELARRPVSPPPPAAPGRRRALSPALRGGRCSWTGRATRSVVCRRGACDTGPPRVDGRQRRLRPRRHPPRPPRRLR